ncbi:MAG: ABC transporter permease [Chloroflexota bacterium]
MRPRPGETLAIAWSLGLVLVALLAPRLAVHSATQPVAPPLSPPGAGLWFGTDDLGRDLWSRLVWGSRVSLGVSLSAAVLTVLLGGAAGLAAAVVRGWAERLILWLANAMLAVPGLLLALVLVAGLGTGLPAVVLAVGLGGVPGYARLARTAFLQASEGGYVTSAVALGSSRTRIALRHLIPNASATLLSMATVHVAWSFMGTTTLTFLGLAGDPSIAEWGAMMNAGRNVLTTNPWPALLPGLAISLTVLSIYTIGSYLARRALPSSGER